MSRSPFLCKTALFLIAVALLTPNAGWAAPAKGQIAGEALSAFRGLLQRLAAASGCILDPDGCSAVRAKSGCIIDPDGGCAAVQAPGGCIIDPNGRNAPGGCILDPDGSTVRSGCVIDPNGSTTGVSQGDGGCIIDLDGRSSK